MRTREELRAVRDLAAAGLSRHEISRRTGVPRSTVVRWLHAGGPRFVDADAATCAGCGGAAHDRLDGDAYRHLLGLYLGDGHIACFPRTYCLRIYLDQRYPGIVAGCVAPVRRVSPANRVAVDLLGIAWTRASDVNIAVARREAVAALDAFVGQKR